MVSALVHMGRGHDGDGVLVHGGGGSPATWDRVMPLLDGLGVPNVAAQLPSCL
jgi:pimeloyl-ACP methyl ester carboxylesterase